MQSAGWSSNTCILRVHQRKNGYACYTYNGASNVDYLSSDPFWMSHIAEFPMLVPKMFLGSMSNRFLFVNLLLQLWRNHWTMFQIKYKGLIQMRIGSLLGWPSAERTEAISFVHNEIGVKCPSLIVTTRRWSMQGNNKRQYYAKTTSVW